LNLKCKIYEGNKKNRKEKKKRKKNMKRASGNPSAQYGEAARSPGRKPNRYPLFLSPPRRHVGPTGQTFFFLQPKRTPVTASEQ
jgi:hypothetical protein